MHTNKQIETHTNRQTDREGTNAKMNW